MGIAIGVGVLLLNICLCVAWVCLRRRTRSAPKHVEEAEANRPLVEQPSSPIIGSASPQQQSYQHLLMALKMRPMSRLPTPAPEKALDIVEAPPQPAELSFESSPHSEPEKSTEAVELAEAPATQLQYPFLSNPTPLPSRRSSHAKRANAKKSARSSLRRGRSFDTASMYSVASAPLSQHDALLMASLEELVRAPPSSAPAWIQYDSTSRPDDLKSIAEVSQDGSDRSPVMSSIAESSLSSRPSIITCLPAPLQPLIRSPSQLNRPLRSPSGSRSLPSRPRTSSLLSSSSPPPSLDGHPSVPPGLYPLQEHDDRATNQFSSPSTSGRHPAHIPTSHNLAASGTQSFYLNNFPIIAPPPRAKAMEDTSLQPTLERPSSLAAMSTPSVAAAGRPVSAAPAVPARSPFRRIDGLPRTLLAGPYAL